MKPKTIETFQYRFGDIILIGRRPEGRVHTTWSIKCDECQGTHVFRKLGTKIWHTSCELTGVEWTITPAEYYIQKPADLARIMGDV